MPLRSLTLGASRALVLELCMLLGGAHAQSPEESAIAAIRRDMVLDTDGQDGHPLPLASGWMDGRLPSGFSPAYQIEQIRHGRYLLPWFGLYDSPAPVPEDTYPKPLDRLYFEPAVQYVAAHHLPLTFATVEWEGLMSRVSAAYAKAGGDVSQIPLSPFDPSDPWYVLGREWARHGTFVRLQQLYPDPPLVLIVQDSEYPKLSANDLHAPYSADDPSWTARRRAIGDAWIEKYRAMLRGFRDGLDAPGWRAHLVIVGYDQFVTSAVGRWGGWTDYSLYVPGRTEPWPLAWDGASVSLYQHDYFPDTDYTVWSPQIEAMNWVSELDAVRRIKPAYWFEMSTWDGQEPGLPSDKLAFYAARGQQYTPLRYGGMVQFGMWLLRPRVVREFRNTEHDRLRFGPYFDAILDAVGRVHDDATLRAFWQGGRLLENRAEGHPYQENLPRELAARPRWFLLDSPSNPPRPWQLDTTLKVFALALERGRRPQRDWLVYAFSPRDDHLDVDVTIPGGPVARVQAMLGGSFTLIHEGDASGRLIGVPARTD